MTTTIDRAEINRRNSMRSTGPKHPKERLRSKLNAVKHGMTAATPVLPGEDPDAFRDRLDDWAEALAPGDVVEQFLVEQAATASWKIERADRVEAARLAAAVRDAADEQRPPPRGGRTPGRAAARRRRLGRRPGLARMVRAILAPGAKARPRRPGLDHPRRIVGRLETTAEGCTWLLERWAELRAPLEQGAAWDEDQFVEAVRLSGRRPLDLTPSVEPPRGVPVFPGRRRGAGAQR